MLRSPRNVSITVDLSTKMLYLYQKGKPTKNYPVAIGKPSTPSPLGNWTVINKKIMNYESIYGTRWLGLSATSYGIHGTDNPSSISTAASSGCIRMHNHDVEEIFPLVSLDTLVTITQHLSTENANPPTSPSTDSYTIQPGDTLWSISQAKGVSLDTIISSNPNLNPHHLIPGTSLQLS